VTSLLVTSDRILILQKAPREDWIIKTEIWFSGLYNYKVVRKGTLIKLHFVVSKQMMNAIEEWLGRYPRVACALHAPTWKASCVKEAYTVRCDSQRVAEDAVRYIQYSFVFFSERAVVVDT